MPTPDARAPRQASLRFWAHASTARESMPTPDAQAPRRAGLRFWAHGEHREGEHADH